jgi:hypothetical protein
MPEPASSFAVGNAPYPASYASPLLNFGQLAQLPDQVFQGNQRQRTMALQNAFPDGLPKDKTTGQLDINAISDTLAKLGGADYAKGLMPYLIEQQMGSAGAAAINDDSGQAPVARPSTNVVGASGPANIRGPAPQGGATSTSSPQSAQPQLSTFGADNNGADTVRSIATELAGGRDLPPQVIPNIAKAFKVDPDAPLSQAQADAIRNRLPPAISGAGPQPQPQNGGGGQQTSQVTGGGAPVNPVGGTGGGGAPAPSALPETPPQGQPPVAASPGTQPAQSQQPGQRLGGQQQPMVVPGVPPGQDPANYANALIDTAKRLHARAAQFAAMQGGQAESQAIENRAKVLEDRSKQIFDFMGTAMQPTPEQKNIASGATAANATITNTAKSSETQLAGIRGSANEYETDLKPKVDLATSILSDPRVYTGTGGDFSQIINRAQAIYGPTAPAQLQEMLSKVTASSILAQINGLKTSMMEAGGAGSSAGRIFQAQVDLMQKASPQLGTTLAGNRALVELERRAGEQAVAMRDLALNYLGPTDANGVPTKHRFLDTGFDAVAANYLKSHPLFTPDEQANPALLGAPTAPTAIKTPQQAQAWLGGMGLKAGDPYRWKGQVKYYKPPAQPGTAQAAPAQ